VIVFPLPVTAGLFAPDVLAFPVALVDELALPLIVVCGDVVTAGDSSPTKRLNSEDIRLAAMARIATIRVIVAILSPRDHLRGFRLSTPLDRAMCSAPWPGRSVRRRASHI
jgi:hypothetical protein